MDGSVVSQAIDPSAIKAAAAFIGLGIVGLGGAIGQGNAIGKALESTAKQPEIKDYLRVNLLIGLAFIESLVLYSLVIAFMQK